jgi:hypothetical protein
MIVIEKRKEPANINGNLIFSCPVFVFSATRPPKTAPNTRVTIENIIS